MKEAINRAIAALKASASNLIPPALADEAASAAQELEAAAQLHAATSLDGADAIDTIFRLAYNVEKNQGQGLATATGAAIIGYRDKLVEKGWEWDTENIPAPYVRHNARKPELWAYFPGTRVKLTRDCPWKGALGMVTKITRYSLVATLVVPGGATEEMVWQTNASMIEELELNYREPSPEEVKKARGNSGALVLGDKTNDDAALELARRDKNGPVPRGYVSWDEYLQQKA